MFSLRKRESRAPHGIALGPGPPLSPGNKVVRAQRKQFRGDNLGCLAKTTHRPHLLQVTVAPRPAAHPFKRYGQLTLGILLILGAGIVAPLPGPGGAFLFAGGMILVLRNSAWARQRWARLKRRFPRVGSFVDRMMRRGSALRRHARDKAAAAN